VSSTATIADAAAAVGNGGVIVYPTETLYGLGVDAGDARALQRLFSLKGRDASSGVSVLVETLDAAVFLIEGEPPPGARALADAFWPGPLTLVVRAAKSVDAALRGPSGGVGLRCSSDPVCGHLLAAAGRPLTSTSANLTGRRPATTVAEARAYFGDRVDCYLDDGPRSAAVASTVVEFLDGSAYLRRSGAIPADRISAIVPISTEG